MVHAKAKSTTNSTTSRSMSDTETTRFLSAIQETEATSRHRKDNRKSVKGSRSHRALIGALVGFIAGSICFVAWERFSREQRGFCRTVAIRKAMAGDVESAEEERERLQDQGHRGIMDVAYARSFK